MVKNLIIGGASNYTWDHLKHWVNSIKKTGFSGDIVLVATNITHETIEKLVQEGVILSIYGRKDEQGNYTAHSNGAPHVERFFYIWNYLNTHRKDYDNVVTTDTRDVVFQSNPFHWLEENLGHKKIVVSSECMKYADEPWNSQNLDEAFGPFFHTQYKNMIIHNVGVLAGRTEYVCDLFFMIFQMSVNRPIPIVDQVVFNVLLQQSMFADVIRFTNNTDAWAAQLGTSLEAVKSGAGDLGAMLANDPTKMILYQTKYLCSQPRLAEDGYVVNETDKEFCIVHQYDRTHAWKDKIISKYED